MALDECFVCFVLFSETSSLILKVRIKIALNFQGYYKKAWLNPLTELLRPYILRNTSVLHIYQTYISKGCVAGFLLSKELSFFFLFCELNLDLGAFPCERWCSAVHTFLGLHRCEAFWIRSPEPILTYIIVMETVPFLVRNGFSPCLILKMPSLWYNKHTLAQSTFSGGKNPLNSRTSLKLEHDF